MEKARITVSCLKEAAGREYQWFPNTLPSMFAGGIARTEGGERAARSGARSGQATFLRNVLSLPPILYIVVCIC